jgi:hypothetical protein
MVGEVTVNHEEKSMPTIPLRAAPLLLAVALLGGVASGCGADPASNAKVASLADRDSSSASGASGAKKPLTDEEILEASKKYAACMREHGVDMPDPTASAGSGTSPGIAVFSASSADGSSDAKSTSLSSMDEANKACADLIADVAPQMGEIDPEAQEKMLEQARAFAKCMREHGVDMPDPQASPNGGMTQTLNVSPDDPALDSAQKACATEGGPGFITVAPDGSAGPANGGGFTISGGALGGGK